MNKESTNLIHNLEIILADTYALYLKSQNYHWHVKGPHFKMLHALFEQQYRELAEAIDTIAERLLIMGHKAPATFKAYDALKTLKDGDSNLAANAMLTELAHDHGILIGALNKAFDMAGELKDEGTLQLLSERIIYHEKTKWMLHASEIV